MASLAQGDLSSRGLLPGAKSRSFTYGGDGNMGIGPSQRPVHTFPPPPSQLTRITSHEPTVPKSLAQRLTEQVESWFGTVDHFRNRVVWATRFVMVDCVGYPYVVFSRQCQVYPYNSPTPSFATPFSTMVVLHNIAHTQGVQAWWRGWYSHLFLRMARRFSITVLDRFVTPPRSLPNSGKNVGTFISYCALRGLAYLATFPLLSFNILEMVQNTLQKVYTGGLLEVVKDRPLAVVDNSHRLSYLHLIGPTILHGFVIDIVFFINHRLASKALPNRTSPGDTLGVVMRGLWVAYFSSFLSETVLYPLETVMARLVCQGMPVLVDNIQNGLEISFVTTFYRGFVDCVLVIWESEGLFGFFRGYSSLLLRYLIHGSLLLLLWRLERAANARLKGTSR